MMPPIKVFTGDDERVPERSECELEWTFVDRKQASIQFAAISAIRCWLSDVDTNTPINGRIGQDVKNLNGGALTAGTSGEAVFTLGLDAADAPIVTASKTEEKHRLVLEVTYTRTSGGAGQLRRQVEFYVTNLSHTP